LNCELSEKFAMRKILISDGKNAKAEAVNVNAML